MTSKQWVFPKSYPETYDKIFSHYPRPLRQIFFNRGFESVKVAEAFLNPSYEHQVNDPYKFNDMQKVVECLEAAVASQDKITVYGDNDADGVCGAVILSKIFKELGANFDVYLPHREKEGYGLNTAAIDVLAKGGTKILITVDCGISNSEEVAHAHTKGMKVIITDHHEQLLKKPDAFAIIHPLVEDEQYPDKFLCGGGVAFKLAQALIIAYPDKFPHGYDRWLIDLVALSTIADFGKLIGENRSLVRFGMIVINKTKNIGLSTLYEKVGLPKNGNPIDARQLSFQIIPLINAAGRMDHAKVAYDLLFTDDKARADKLADSLIESNTERYRITEKIYKEAKEQIKKTEDDQKILVAYRDDWVTTVGGIVASRLTHEYHKPTLIIGKRAGAWSGSARSIPGFHIGEALKKVEDYLEQYGGHAGAAGFTVKGNDLTPFIQSIKKVGEKGLKTINLKPTFAIDAIISLNEVTNDLIDWLEKLKPFGQGNKKPLFLIRDCTATYKQILGKNGEHMKVIVAKPNGQGSLKFIFFNSAKQYGEQFAEGTCFDVVCELDYNIWRGIAEIQLKIIDLKLKD